MLPVLVGVSILVFLTMHLAPGDPVKIILGPRATQQAIERLRHELGLDKPFLVQYFNWIANVLKGDWGRSIQLRREVFPLVISRFGFTAMLAFTAIFVASLCGMIAGLGAAFKPLTVWDRTFTFFAILGFSIPAFWLGLVLQLVFGLKIGWFPVSGISSPGGGNILDVLHHMVLPTMALAAEPMALIGRMTRSSLLEVVQEDFVKTARAKGLPEAAILARHALKNAFVPILTVIGMQLGFVLAGSVFVEVIFSWPGIGALMVNGILARDFPLVQGAILIVSVSYVFVNLAVDILYAYVNPTIRYE